MDFPLVAIIILNWRKSAETLMCLGSLSHITYPNALTIVVDNHSGDDSVLLVHEYFPNVILLETGANLGYAGGNNIGVTWALRHGADFTLILNNDTIVDTGFLEPLIGASQHYPGPVITTPMICEMDRPDVIWTMGSDIDWRIGAPVHLKSGDVRKQWQNAPPQFVTFAPGTAMLVPRSAWECAGLMDEDYFLYFEEADWCLHAVRAGCQVVAVPSSCVWHETEIGDRRTSPTITYYMTRNTLRFLRRNADGPQRWQGQVRAALLAAWHSLGDFRHGRYDRAHARWQGIYDFLVGRFGPLQGGASLT